MRSSDPVVEDRTGIFGSVGEVGEGGYDEVILCVVACSYLFTVCM